MGLRTHKMSKSVKKLIIFCLKNYTLQNEKKLKELINA